MAHRDDQDCKIGSLTVPENSCPAYPNVVGVGNLDVQPLYRLTEEEEEEADPVYMWRISRSDVSNGGVS